MKQVIRRGIGEMIVDEVPEPKAPPHHALIRPHFSLISSGTETADIHADGVLKEVRHNPSHIATVLDVASRMGPIRTAKEITAKFSDYAVLGYSGAGVLAEKHPTVTDLQVGDRVAYGGEGTGHAETIVTGRQLIARVPDGVPFDQASFATLGSIALNAVRIGEIGIGDRVAIVGLGLVGQLCAQLARVQGGRVIAIDLMDERVDAARATGAHHGLVANDSLQEAVGALTDGKGADVVIVAAAAKKSSAPARSALEICRDRGRIVVVGAVEMSFPWDQMYMKEIQLRMARAYGPGSYDPTYERAGQDYPFAYVRWTENRNMEEFLELLDLGSVDVLPLISHRMKLDDAPEAYKTIMAPGDRSLAVVLEYPAATTTEDVAVRPPVRRVNVPGVPIKKDKLGVALIGAGNIAKWEHVPVVKELADLRAVYSSSGVRGKAYALRFGAQYCTTDLEEVLADPTVDALILASRNQQHAPQALAALRAGKHVFVEKPMALTEDECRELIDAVAETGCQLTVGFNRRFSPFYTPLHEQLAKRTSPAVVSCRINSPGISGNFWMADPAIGGAILGEACHFVDLMAWLLDSEIESVFGYSLPLELTDPIGFNNMVATFKFADGSIGTLNYSTVGSATSGGERVEIYSQGVGGVTEDFKKLRIHRSNTNKKSAVWAKKGYREQLARFFDAIRAGRTPDVSVIDGARATMGCLMMIDSARTGEMRSMDFPWMTEGEAGQP